jgi:hypothetical protein
MEEIRTFFCFLEFTVSQRSLAGEHEWAVRIICWIRV